MPEEQHSDLSARRAAPSVEQRVAQGIERVREEIALDASAPRWVVPLHGILDGFVLVANEVDGLTYERAARFVSERTGTEMFAPSGFTESDVLAGLLFAYAENGLCQGHILVRRDDPVDRRRFSVAHELGHFVLHLLLFVEAAAEETERPQLALVDGFAYGQSGKEDDDAADDHISQADYAGATEAGLALPSEARMEQEADAFAAALLMPEAACRALFEKHREDYGERRAVLARRMATDLLVSKSAMYRRLTTLELGH